jgi:tryptophan halogenase
MKKLVVLGGGSAGWITAIFLNRIFPKDSVTLIQSSEIGIIGVGEATTPTILSYLNDVRIDYRDVVKNTNGSIKNGIKFDNWNGDKKSYYHPFSDRLVNFEIENLFGGDCQDFYVKELIAKKLAIEDYTYNTKLSDMNKVDVNGVNFALHFDATMFAKHLQKIGIKRGIKVIEGVYKTCTQDENGFIKNISLNDGREFDVDFIFDCSGLAKLLIGNLYKEKWISYEKYLPMKKAIPFWLETEQEIRPYTSAIAMKYGWMWQIPLQHRTGAGYIFDSDYINEDQALSEAETYLNQKLEIRKIISFNAGRYENFWVKNCMAVGLSSSFVEPLESTSIFLTIEQLETFKQFVNEIDNPNEKSISLFNDIVSNNMEDTLSFIYLHYMTKRNDSEFWRQFREKHPVPKKLQSVLELIADGNLRYFNFKDTKTTGYFPLISYLHVCYGLKLIDSLNNSNYDNIKPSLNEYKHLVDKLSKTAILHKDFLVRL